MAAELSRLLRWYPPAWRDRYGEDLAAYMQDSFGDGRPPLRARWSLLVGGLAEHIRMSGVGGDSVPPAERIRAGALVVLCSWTAFMIAGANFAKLSEHFDQALPQGTSGPHHLADLAYTIIQTGAAAAGIAVIVGAVLALPAFVRFLHLGGWRAIKRWVIPASAATVVVVATFVPLRAWAHHLSDGQRNGGSVGYGALFLTWAGVAALALILWTAVAVAAGRRVVLPHRLLAAEAGLGFVVAAAMVVILAATALWWAVIAQRAPLFLSSDPSTPINGRLIATAIIMAASAACATSGVVRVGRSWPQWRRL
jgi:hypothetical protein